MPRLLARSDDQPSVCAPPCDGNATVGRALSSPDAEWVGSCGNELCKFKFPSPERPPAALFPRQLIYWNDTDDRVTDSLDLRGAAQRPPQQLDNQRQEKSEDKAGGGTATDQKRTV